MRASATLQWPSSTPKMMSQRWQVHKWCTYLHSSTVEETRQVKGGTFGDWFCRWSQAQRQVCCGGLVAVSHQESLVMRLRWTWVNRSHPTMLLWLSLTTHWQPGSPDLRMTAAAVGPGEGCLRHTMNFATTTTLLAEHMPNTAEPYSAPFHVSLYVFQNRKRQDRRQCSRARCVSGSKYPIGRQVWLTCR